jgi:hypothetical protein
MISENSTLELHTEKMTYLTSINNAHPSVLNGVMCLRFGFKKLRCMKLEVSQYLENQTDAFFWLVG